MKYLSCRPHLVQEGRAFCTRSGTPGRFPEEYDAGSDYSGANFALTKRPCKHYEKSIKNEQDMTFGHVCLGQNMCRPRSRPSLLLSC